MNLKGLKFEDLELKGVEIVVVVVGEVKVQKCSFEGGPAKSVVFLGAVWNVNVLGGLLRAKKKKEQGAPKIRCVGSTRLEIFKISEATHPQADPSEFIPFQTPLRGVG